MKRFNPENFDDFANDKIIDHSILWKDALIGKKGNLQAQIDIVIESNLTIPQSIELFNFDNSISHTANQGLTTLQPFDLYELKRQLDSFDGCGSEFTINYIFFDRFGNLIFQPREGEYVKISCKQCSYKALMISSQKNIFHVNKMRMGFSEAQQIDNELTYITKTFLGFEKKNIFSPRAFFRPMQYQSLMVDMVCNFDIDGEKGFQYLINAKENNRITLNFFISKYFKQTF